ncbi:hypothetical protein Tco_1458677 [Tanacetum coccineum]
MSKVLQEIGFGSLPSSTEANPRDHVKSISTIVEADTNPIRRMGSSQYAVSRSHNSKLIYETRQTTISFLIRLNDYYYEENKGSYGPQFLEAHMKLHISTIPYPERRKTYRDAGAIQAQLNSLRREIKKVNEKVYAAQVGCEQCKGPHYTKYFPLKEEGKTLEEAYYTQFGGPFQGGGYRAAASGFYQRKNENPSYQERRQYMEDTLRKFMSESAKQNEENSNMIKEI